MTTSSDIDSDKTELNDLDHLILLQYDKYHNTPNEPLPALFKRWGTKSTQTLIYQEDRGNITKLKVLNRLQKLLKFTTKHELELLTESETGLDISVNNNNEYIIFDIFCYIRDELNKHPVDIGLNWDSGIVKQCVIVLRSIQLREGILLNNYEKFLKMLIDRLVYCFDIGKVLAVGIQQNLANPLRVLAKEITFFVILHLINDPLICHSLIKHCFIRMDEVFNSKYSESQIGFVENSFFLVEILKMALDKFQQKLQIRQQKSHKSINTGVFHLWNKHWKEEEPVTMPLRSAYRSEFLQWSSAIENFCINVVASTQYSNFEFIKINLLDIRCICQQLIKEAL